MAQLSQIFLSGDKSQLAVSCFSGQAGHFTGHVI